MEGVTKGELKPWFVSEKELIVRLETQFKEYTSMGRRRVDESTTYFGKDLYRKICVSPRKSFFI